MIPEDEAAVDLFEPVGASVIRREPVVCRIILRDFFGRWPRMEAD
jgi:hypothetical protein